MTYSTWSGDQHITAQASNCIRRLGLLGLFIIWIGTVVWTLSMSGAQCWTIIISVYHCLWRFYVCSSLWTWHLSVLLPINTMCIMCVHFWISIWIRLSLKSKKKSTSVHRLPCYIWRARWGLVCTVEADIRAAIPHEENFKINLGPKHLMLFKGIFC